MKKEFYTGLKEAMISAIQSLHEIQKNIDAIDAEIANGRLNARAINELKGKRSALRVDLQDATEKEIREIKQYCDAFVENLKEQDALDGTQIVEGDLAILQSGIRLTAQDYRAMLKRNATNRTMTKLALAHAQANEVDVGTAYVGNSDLINAVQVMSDVAKTLYSWHDGEDGVAGSMFEQFFGPESAFSKTFSED